MEIFLSWSGDQSRDLTEAFRNWIPLVLQNISPFMSQQDIDLGDNWNEKINSQLEKSTIGIIFVTPENVNSSWLNFEAGALSKSLEKGSKIIPILFGDNDINIKLSGSPLKQFQSVIHPDKKGFKSLIGTLNNSSENPLDQEKINKTFEKWWPDFEHQLNDINEKYLDNKSNTEENSRDSVKNSELLISNMSDKIDKLLRSQTYMVPIEVTNQLTKSLYQLQQFQMNAEVSDRERKVLGEIISNFSNPINIIYRN